MRDVVARYRIVRGMRILSLALLGATLCLHGAFAQNTKNFPSIGRIHREDPRLDQLISPDAKIEVLASGFEWAEGPVWSKREKALLFSDVVMNQVMIWREGKGVSVYLNPSGFTGILPYSKEPGSNG